MSRRIPSTSSAVPGSRSSIRHRSGAYSPRPGANDELTYSGLRRRVSPSESEHSSRTDRTIKVQVEDTDDAEHAQPTVLLIRKSRVSQRKQGRYKALPGLPFEDRQNAHIRDLREGLSHLLDASERDEPRSSVPSSRVDDDHEHCDARPPQPERGASDASKQSRLPTPNYPEGPGRSTVGRTLSYFSRMPSLRARPPAPRQESETSTYSSTSEQSTAVSHAHSHSHSSVRSRSTRTAWRVPTAIKDKRPLLVSKFSTSDKFTQKFPRPRAMRGLTVPDVRAPTILEEGEDIVIERVDRWTLHKWCLVASVCTVFVYGTAGLACAVLTFFRGTTIPILSTSPLVVDRADICALSPYTQPGQGQT